MVGRKEPCESYVLRLVAAIIISIGITPPILALETERCEKEVHPAELFYRGRSGRQKAFPAEEFLLCNLGQEGDDVAK